MKDVAGMYAKYKAFHYGADGAASAKRGRAASKTTKTATRSRSASASPQPPAKRGRAAAAKKSSKASKRARSTSGGRGAAKKAKKEKRAPSAWAMAVAISAGQTGEKPPYPKGSMTYNAAQELKTAPNLQERYKEYQRTRPAKPAGGGMSDATKQALRAYSQALSAYAKHHNMTVKAVKEARKEGTLTRDEIMKFAAQ